MKRVIGVMIACSLLVVGCAVALAAEPNPEGIGASEITETLVQKQAEAISKEFSDAALERVKADAKPGVNLWLVGNAIRGYSLRTATTLLTSQVSEEGTKALMNKSVAPYGKCLVEVMKGKAVPAVADVYVKEITNLYTAEKIGKPVQDRIISATRNHFSEISGLLKAKQEAPKKVAPKKAAEKK